jgi:hypothetical protein
MDEVARAVFVDPVLRVVEPVRVRHGIEMIKITEILVKPVQCRQILVQITEMVLAELGSFIAERLQHRS